MVLLNRNFLHALNGLALKLVGDTFWLLGVQLIPLGAKVRDEFIAVLDWNLNAALAQSACIRRFGVGNLVKKL